MWSTRSSVVQIYQLIKRADFDQREQERRDQSGYYAQKGAPYGFHISNLPQLGSACPAGSRPTARSPPTTSRPASCLWNEPFGQVQKWGFYMPKSWGSVTIGAPVDHQVGPDLHRRLDGFAGAGDRPQDRQGAVEVALVDAPAVSMPAMYTYKGRQYVVFVAGGNAILTPRVSDQVVAYALPD